MTSTKLKGSNYLQWLHVVRVFLTAHGKHVARFIENNIVCHYKVSHEMIYDNGMQFKNEVQEVFKKYEIQHHKSSP